MRSCVGPRAYACVCVSVRVITRVRLRSYTCAFACMRATECVRVLARVRALVDEVWMWIYLSGAGRAHLRYGTCGGEGGTWPVVHGVCLRRMHDLRRLAFGAWPAFRVCQE